MKILILSLVSLMLFSCGKLESVLDKADNDIPNNLLLTNARLSEVERKTVLAAMKPELEDAKNYQILSPVPYDLMAPGKLFAENIKALEVIEWMYTHLSKINNARYDDNFGKPIDGEKNPESLEYEKNKLGLFNALCVVSTFLPESVVDELVSKVYTSEEYASTTIMNILAMRVYFIQKVMLKEKYASSKLTDIGAVESAIQYNQAIEKILKLPFAGYVRSDVSGFVLMADLNTQLTFDLKVADMKANWKNIERGMSTYLKVTQFSSNAQDSRVNAARAKVSAGLKAYETKAP